MKPSQPFLDFAPVAPQRVTMAPSAIEARRSGLRAARAKATPQMAEYRAVLEQCGPLSDQEAARILGYPLATICGRRNDWMNAMPGCIGVRGRVSVTHPDGRKSSRTLWLWCGQNDSSGDKIGGANECS